MTTEDDFQDTLDADPSADQLRLVFADWLQDHGDPRAEGYRALGRRSKRPRPDSQQGDAGRRFFTWFDRQWQHDGTFHPNSLPTDWFKLLEEGGQFSDFGDLITAESPDIFGHWRDYESRRDAEDAAALAFAKLPAERRGELLNPVPGGH
jgi:uncharacterized protein (TIGR02996 family)